MATTVTRYVNTDSSAGGDGTTNNTSGSTRAYATLAAALSSFAGRDLVSNNEVWIINVSAPSGVQDTTNATLDCTSDATRYPRIICTQDHGGKWNTGVYRLASASPITIVSTCIVSQLIGLQISVTGSGGANCNPGIYIQSGGAFIDRCIVRGTEFSGSGTGGIPIGIYASGDKNVYISNSLIYDFSMIDEYALASGVQCYYNTNFVMSNCTIINCRRGVRGSGAGSAKIRNCIFQCNSENGAFIDFAADTFNSANCKNNLTSDASAVGASSVTSTTLTFVDKASDDFHLASSDTAAINAGADLSADVPSLMLSVNDADNVARSGTWDIGADEYVAPVTGYKNLPLLGVG